MSTNDSQLRALIRLIPPARALKDQLDKSLHLETYAGTGDFAISSLRGLHASITRITDEPYLMALNVNPPEGSGDKEKVSLALLAASQLLAYLMGEAGLVNLGGGGNYSVQTAPNINLNNIEAPVGLDKIVEMVGKNKDKNKDKDKEDRSEES